MSKKSFNKPKHLQESEINKAKKALKINHNDFISFSFKYFNNVPDKFDFTTRKSDYFIMLFDRLKNLCSWRTQELYSNRSSATRCHPIDWSETTEDSFNLKNEEQLVDTPYQFEITANEYGRVHGFFIDSTFYVRWFDPEHNLYSNN